MRLRQLPVEGHPALMLRYLLLDSEGVAEVQLRKLSRVRTPTAPLSDIYIYISYMTVSL